MAARRPRVLTLSAKESSSCSCCVRDDEAYGLELVSASRGRLKRGTVYVTLGRMEEKGYITSRLEDAPPEAGGCPAGSTSHGARTPGARGLVAAREVSDPGGDAMSAPNGRLRHFLSRHCSAATMERLVDPILTDTRDRGESCSSPRAAMDRPMDSRCGRDRACSRRLPCSAGRGSGRFVSGRSRIVARWPARWPMPSSSQCAGVKLLMLPPLLRFPLSRYQELALYLVPQAFPIALPVGLLLGLLYGFRSSVAVAAVANPGHGRGDRLLCLVLRRPGVGRAGFEPGLPGGGAAGFPDSQGAAGTHSRRAASRIDVDGRRGRDVSRMVDDVSLSLGAGRGARRADRVGVSLDRPPPHPRTVASRHRGDRVMRCVLLVDERRTGGRIPRDASASCRGVAAQRCLRRGDRPVDPTNLAERANANGERQRRTLALPPEPIEADGPAPAAAK